MSVPRSRKEKRTWAEETARVMAIARAIDEEIRVIGRLAPGEGVAHMAFILEVADRIAARTED